MIDPVVLAAVGVYLTPVAGALTARERLRTGSWPIPPHPRAVGRDLRRLAHVADDRLRGYLSGWREDSGADALERVVGIALGGALIVRAGVHTLLWLVVRDDAPDVDDAVAWSPIEWPSAPARVIAGCFSTMVGVTLLPVAPPLQWGWPTLVETAVRAWLFCVWFVIGGDLFVALVDCTLNNHDSETNS